MYLRPRKQKKSMDHMKTVIIDREKMIAGDATRRLAWDIIEPGNLYYVENEKDERLNTFMDENLHDIFHICTCYDLFYTDFHLIGLGNDTRHFFYNFPWVDKDIEVKAMERSSLAPMLFDEETCRTLRPSLLVYQDGKDYLLELPNDGTDLITQIDELLGTILPKTLPYRYEPRAVVAH